MTTFNNAGSLANNPCKDCSERKPNCHSKCVHYKMYKHEIEVVKEKMYEEKKLRYEAGIRL